MATPTTPSRIREVNARYHDAAAPGYDAKWGIDYGETGRAQVGGKLRKALGSNPERFERALEIGAGTGYFTLNLLLDGAVEQATCTDISPGMLRELRRNARRLGLNVDTVTCEAAELPFADASFDLVLGHAVLHHLPDLPSAFAEFRRVLAPGGTLLFAGEPSSIGDRLATAPKRGGLLAAPVWRRLVGAGAADAKPRDDRRFEGDVDVHAFVPPQLDRLAREAGFEQVRVRGEELLANWFGWANRAMEATAKPAEVPWLWRQYAYRGYLALQALDERLLERRLPSALFYNLMLAARVPVA